MRCDWARNELSVQYHDAEWGVPQHDDGRLFEFLILEGAQAGLSWDTILRKRENYRAAFDDFDPQKIALYDERKRAELLNNEGIVRNRLKVAGAVKNAQAFLEAQREHGTFDAYIWGFTSGATLLSVLSIGLLGSESIRWFGWAMVVGILSGTWSTIAVAMPVTMLVYSIKERQQKSATSSTPQTGVRAKG